MIKIENVETMGWGGAIRGMRNAMNSWDKSDSKFCRLDCITTDVNLDEEPCNFMCEGNLYRGFLQIGEADMKLCKNLIKAGSSDRKFMRMIHVQADVTAPLFLWKELDTYKVGTVANSCSTMHTLHKRDLTIDDFSHEHLSERSLRFLQDLLDEINRNRELYVKGFKGVPGDNACDVKPYDKAYWWQMIQLLPSSFNQKRTIDLNYETLFSIYHQRKNHKLDEWREFCKWIETLPYMKEFLGLDEPSGNEEAKE